MVVFGYGSKIAGLCTIENFVIFGGAVLMGQGCRVGTWTLVQSGCRFKKDIPPYIVAAHEPITYYGVNTKVLLHNNFTEKILKHIANAYRLIYQDSASIEDILIKIEEQVPMSAEIKHIIQFVGESKLGLISR